MWEKKGHGVNSEEQAWAEFLLEHGYSEAGAYSAAAKIETMQPDLKTALINWVKSGEIPEFTVEDFDISGLVEHKELSVPAAFLMLDWLMRDPDSAKKALSGITDELVVSEGALLQIKAAEERDYEEG